MVRRLMCAVLVILLTAPVAVRPRAAVAEEAAATAAVESLSKCIRQSQQLAAVILMDKSKSLRDTDEFGRRSLLGAALVDALSAATGFEIEGRANQVDVLLAGFGSNVTNVRGDPLQPDDWRTLGPATLSSIDNDLAMFAKLDNDDDTDYVEALTSAMASLSRHASEMNESRPQTVCRLVLWFTDGKFDISTSAQRRPWAQDIALDSNANRELVKKRGRELLCAAQGVANELRRQSTYVFTMGLTGPKFTGEDERLLRSVTLGVDGCGETEGALLGWYLGDADIDGLRQCVVKVFSGLPCSPTVPTACTNAAPCEYRFEVDASTASLSGYAIVRPDAGRLSLSVPGGEELVISGRRTEADFDGARVRIEGTDGSYRIDANLEQNTALSGEWVLRFVPATQADFDAQVSLRSAYSFSISPPESVVAGDDARIAIQLTGRGGVAVGPDGFVTDPVFTVVAKQGADDVPAQVSDVDADGRAEVTLDLPDGGSATSVDIVVDGAAATEDGQTVDLGEQRASLQVLVPGFGRPPAAINVGLVEAVRAKERLKDNSQPVLPTEKDGLVAKFTGPDSGDGTVCLREASFEGLVGASATMSLGTEDQCASLPEGEEMSLPVILRIDQPSPGHLSGIASFEVTNNRTGEHRSFDVAVEGDVVVPPPDPWTDVQMVWSLLVLALGFLVLVWFLGAFWAAGLGRNVSEVMVFTGPVLLTPNHLSAEIDPNWSYVTASGRREASTPDMRMKAPIAFFRQNRVKVKPTSDEAFAWGTLGRTRWRRQLGLIAHGLAGQWVFITEKNAATAGGIEGTLHLLIPAAKTGHRVDGAADPTEEVVADAAKQLPGHFNEIMKVLNGGDGSVNEEFGNFVGYGRRDN